MKIPKLLAGLCLTVLSALAAGTSQAALIGLTAGEPTIDFGAGGMISYKAATGLVTISGVPSTLFRSDPFLFAQIMGTTADNERLITVQFKVDAAGNFLAGNGTTDPDLIIKGAVDVNADGIIDFDGVLLTANVAQFGFQYGGTTGASTFDVRLNAVSGLLASYYSGHDLAMVITSQISTEFPNGFNGAFTANFTGQAQGVLGETNALPLLCQIEADAFCSVNGSPNSTKCRIQTTKSEKHWDWDDRSTSGASNGQPYRRYTYGMHGDPVPAWTQKFPPTPVTFNYVIKNTGTTPISGLVVDDSFDIPVTGAPTTLAAGQTVTLTRTESLREGIEDVLMASGTYSSAHCADRSTVVVKNKLRQRRRHDYDDYDDKGENESGSYK